MIHLGKFSFEDLALVLQGTQQGEPPAQPAKAIYMCVLIQYSRTNADHPLWQISKRLYSVWLHFAGLMLSAAALAIRDGPATATPGSPHPEDSTHGVSLQHFCIPCMNYKQLMLGYHHSLGFKADAFAIAP